MTIEQRIARVRRQDAFLSTRLELILAFCGVIASLAVIVFTAYDITKNNPVWRVCVDGMFLGLLIGVPIGRFVVPSVIEYCRDLTARMDVALSEPPREE